MSRIMSDVLTPLMEEGGDLKSKKLMRRRLTEPSERRESLIPQEITDMASFTVHERFVHVDGVLLLLDIFFSLLVHLILSDITVCVLI